MINDERYVARGVPKITKRLSEHIVGSFDKISLEDLTEDIGLDEGLMQISRGGKEY